MQGSKAGPEQKEPKSSLVSSRTGRGMDTGAGSVTEVRSNPWGFPVERCFLVTQESKEGFLESVMSVSKVQSEAFLLHSPVELEEVWP